MTVDFYVLEHNKQKAYHFTCRLIEKAFYNKHQIYVHCDHAQDAALIDDLLWTYQDDSFLPHEVCSSDQTEKIIQIGFQKNMKSSGDVLINFSEAVPPFHHNFQRIIEIVYDDPNVQHLARIRYKFYRAKNYALQTHKLKD